MKRQDREKLRLFILDNLEDHPRDLAAFTARQFGVTRETANTYLRQLSNEGLIKGEGRTRSRTYSYCALRTLSETVPITNDAKEDAIWREYILPNIRGVPDNIISICNYGFTEIVNNAIEHSGGSWMKLYFERTYRKVTMVVHDNGIGIFEKIKNELKLEDRRHAILELSKGKLTTEESKHTGEGIFFTSRMFTRFMISSLEYDYITIPRSTEGFLMEIDEPGQETLGTRAFMEILTSADYSTTDIYSKYTDDAYRFSKTYVPLRLAKYEGEQLVSRSQARRVMNRLDRFSEIMLDFSGVSEIGQAFADEIFRVYANDHPKIHLYHINADPDVGRMIQHAKANYEEERSRSADTPSD